MAIDLRRRAPKGARRVLLERAIAWHLQAAALGGLPASTERILQRAIGAQQKKAVIDRSSAGGSACGSPSGSKAILAAPRALPSNGTRFIREWGGKTHIIDVIENGFVWEGNAYRSLSVIAKAITGTHWSGPILRPMTSNSRFRCAIYTRKSSEEGLEQDFNSLDAQREACEAFIASQASLGWKAVRDRYDDGGISGGTLDRPALQRLLDDIRAGRIDVVVVYKSIA